MPNFDFLKPGSPEAPADMEVRPPRYRTWGWSIETTPWYGRLGRRSNDKKIEYALACLAEDALYIRTGYKNLNDRTRAISELEAFEPSAVLTSNCRRYPLSAVCRLRYSDTSGTLDLVYFDGRGEQIVHEASQQARDIFEALRRRLAPNVAIEREPVRGWTNLKEPVNTLGQTIMLAISLISVALIYDKNAPRRGGNDAVADAIEGFMDQFGPTPIVATAVVAVLVAVGSVIWRYRHPLQLHTVTVKQ